MPGLWCTVTTCDADGRRYSLDLQANSKYDAAHLYLDLIVAEGSGRIPIPTLATTFEVVAQGKIHYVKGADLQQWIQLRRAEWNGPRGELFRRRATLE